MWSGRCGARRRRVDPVRRACRRRTAVTAFWACALVAVASAAVSLFFAVDGLRGSRPDAVTASRYALARSISLFAVALTGLFSASEAFVAAVATAMILVQSLDALVGVGLHDRVKTFGPAIMSLVGLATLLWMFGT